MQELNEKHSKKVIFFAPSALAPIISRERTLAIPDLIYHGLIQDKSQEVFWNPSLEPVEDNICVIAFGAGVEEAKKYLHAIYHDNPHIKAQVLLVDEAYHDVSSFHSSKISFERVSTSKNLSLYFIDKSERKSSSFFEAQTIIIDAEQMHVFQRMMQFLEEKNGFTFNTSLGQKLSWYFTSAFSDLKGDLVEKNLSQSSGFAYEQSMTRLPFIYQYNSDLAASSPLPIPARPRSFFAPSSRNVMIGTGVVIAIAGVIATGILSGWEIALIVATIMAAVAMIAYIFQSPMGESTKAPHSFKM